MLVLIALPIIAYGLLVALSRRVLLRSTLPAGWAASLVVGGVGLFTLVAVLTELLNAFALLRPVPSVVAWVAAIVALGLVFVSHWRAARPNGGAVIAGPDFPALWRGPTAWLWIVVGLIVLFTLIVAIAAPPITHDGLGYHLPRQIRWMELGRIRHYATNDMRELSFPPLAEYAQMHTMLLTGGDVFVHLPQWLSYALAALAAALGCQALGRSRAGPFAALLVVTIPIFYLQATSPKNDGVLVFLCVAFAWLVIHLLRNPRCGVVECLLLGLVLGCAALTKTTAVLLLFPWCVLVGVWLLVRLRLGALWRGAIIAVVALVLVAPHSARNVHSFDHPLGPLLDEDGGFSLGTERRDLAAIGSNAMRNLALHAMLASNEDARAIERFVRDLHAKLGWDPDDPRTTWRRSYFAQAGLDKEGNAPAPVHVLYFFLAAPILMVLVVRRREALPAAVAWSCVAAGFVLFVAMVKWNQWHTRLHAPMVAMATIPIAVAFGCVGLRWLHVAVVAVASVPAIWMLAWAAAISIDRPLIGPTGVLTHPRNEQVRWWNEYMVAEGARLVEVLRDVEPGDVAVIVADAEYNVLRHLRAMSPHWRSTGLHARLGNSPHIDHRWTPPEVLVTAFHVQPAFAEAGQLFERVSEPGMINVYRAVEERPARGGDEPLASLGRYQALPDSTAAGEMQHGNPYFKTSYGLVVPASGFRVPLAASDEPRVLFVSLHPMSGGPSDARVLLGEDALAEWTLTPEAYQSFTLEIPPMAEAGELRFELPAAQQGNRPFGAAVGWIQLATERQIADYDRR